MKDTVRFRKDADGKIVAENAMGKLAADAAYDAFLDWFENLDLPREYPSHLASSKDPDIVDRMLRDPEIASELKKFQDEMMGGPNSL